jgi:hypothetical protein
LKMCVGCAYCKLMMHCMKELIQAQNVAIPRIKREVIF